MRLIVVCIAVALTGIIVWSLPVWSSATGEKTIFIQDGREFDQNQLDFLVAKFAEVGIHDFVTQQNKLKIPVKYRSQCNQIISSDEFCQVGKKVSHSATAFSNPFISPSEKSRLAKNRKIEQLQDILKRITGIQDAVIVHDQQKTNDFQRHQIQTAAITLWAQESKTIGLNQATTARRIVCKAFAGLEESEVLVVDGDTGNIFSGNNPESVGDLEKVDQTELESTRQILELQARKVLQKFGELQVKIQMELEKRTIESSPEKSTQNQEPIPPGMVAEVISNGTGSIRTSVIESPQNKAESLTATVLIRKLQRIEVTIQRQSIEDYTRQRLATNEDLSDEQVSRGLVAMRNEITKELIRWLRRHDDIELGSDLVSVSILPTPQAAQTSNVNTGLGWEQNLVLPVVAALGLIFAGLLIFTSKKSRLDRRPEFRSATPLSSPSHSSQQPEFSPERENSPSVLTDTPLDHSPQGIRGLATGGGK